MALAFILIALLIAFLAAGMFMRNPSHSRDWLPKHGTQTDVSKNPDGAYVIHKVRNFTYSRDGAEHQEWVQNITVDPRRAKRLWYMLEPFTNLEAVAHPYFIFEFDDGRTQCFTIEGKRLRNQGYSGIKGLLNAYELGYIWMTEHDCIGMPLAQGAKALNLYPLKLPQEVVRTLLEKLLTDTANLFAKPRFYNTLFHNCTTLFAEAVNSVAPKTLPYDIAWHLPGYSDRYLMRIGLIKTDSSFQSTREQHNILLEKDALWNIVTLPEGQCMNAVFALLQTKNESKSQ